MRLSGRLWGELFAWRFFCHQLGGEGFAGARWAERLSVRHHFDVWAQSCDGLCIATPSIYRGRFFICGGGLLRLDAGDLDPFLPAGGVFLDEGVEAGGVHGFGGEAQGCLLYTSRCV